MAKASKPAPARPAKRTAKVAAKRAQKSSKSRVGVKVKIKSTTKAKTKPADKSARRKAKPERLLRARPETLRLRSIAASLTVGDLERSLVLYSKGFGFFVERRWEADGKLEGVTLRAGTCELNLSQDDGAKGRERRKGEGIRLWLETVQDLDALAERAESFGAQITSWPAAQEWGVRSFSADDLDGYHLSFFHRL
ncbi:MAG: VOC family protein [Thermoanaerobaculia bacterium]|nr:VOC family protein [Thermoanaerobaculia bacterium]